MGLFSKNKASEQVQELSPEQKVARVLEAISKYISENKEALQNDKEKAQRLRDIAAEAEQLSQGDVNEAQADQLVEKAKAEGLNLDLETPDNTEAPKTKKSNKKIAAYLIGALFALGVIWGGVYAYNNSNDKNEDNNKEKAKTEQTDKKKEDNKSKQDGKKDPKKWGNVAPTDASYEDHVKKLQEISKKNTSIKESLGNVK